MRVAKYVSLRRQVVALNQQRRAEQRLCRPEPPRYGFPARDADDAWCLSSLVAIGADGGPFAGFDCLTGVGRTSAGSMAWTSLSHLSVDANPPEVARYRRRPACRGHYRACHPTIRRPGRSGLNWLIPFRAFITHFVVQNAQLLPILYKLRSELCIFSTFWLTELQKTCI